MLDFRVVTRGILLREGWVAVFGQKIAVGEVGFVMDSPSFSAL